MRVLCTCVPGYGHLHPMVPLARALQEAGHVVGFTTDERFCRRVEGAGFSAFPAGLGSGKVAERTMALPDVAGLGPDDVWRFGGQMFAAVAAPAKVPDLVAIIERWKPDLVVHDVTDFSGPVAAAHAGIPWAAQSLGPLFPMEFSRIGADLVAPLWEAWGMTPRPLGGMFASAYVDICPPSLQSTEIAEISSVAYQLRPVAFDAVPGEVLPGWVDELGSGPTVYVTLGTLANDAPRVMEMVVEGLRDQPINLVVTVGPGHEPGELGPQSPNVRVERYVPQSLLFPRCDAVVSHAGSGTTLSALAHGLPLLLLPQGANQFWNAERCADLGTGIRLLPSDVTPDLVDAAVRDLLEDPSYSERASRLASEIAAMPGPEEAVAVLERLVAGT